MVYSITNMEEIVMDEYEHYYDGIPKEIENMTLEELEKRIEEEEKKCDAMNKDT